MEHQQRQSSFGSLDDEIKQLQHVVKTEEVRKKRLPVRMAKRARGLRPLKRFKVLSRTKKAMLLSFAGLILLQPIIFFFSNNPEEVQAATGTATLRPDGDNTAGWLLCNNAACGGTAHYTLVDEDPASDSDYVNLGTAGTTGETDAYTMQDPTINGTFLATTQVQVKWRAGTPACQNTCDIVAVNIFINGALQTAQNQNISATTTNYTTTFSGSWAAINDLRIQFVRSRQGSGGSNATHDDDIRLYQAYADVTYTYSKVYPSLTQKGYIWEMDDASGDGSGALAAGNTAITMRKGEKATLRAQLRNTGGPVDIENFGLFYDKNDGIWSKVKSFAELYSGPSGSQDCQGFNDTGGSSNFRCEYLVDGVLGASIIHMSLAINPSTDLPEMAFVAGQNLNTAGDNLIYAQYVGSGGNCDTFLDSGGSDEWQCTTIIDDTGTSRLESVSLAFTSGGKPYISLNTGSGTDQNLAVAEYVGSGGNCDGFFDTGGSDAWQCTLVIDGATSDYINTAIAISATGVPYITSASGNVALNTSGNNLVVANYVGSGGNCDGFDGAGGSDAWQCATVIDGDHTSLDYYEPRILFSPTNTPYVVSYNYSEALNTTGTNLVVSSLRSSGSGGNCDGFDDLGGSDAWDCVTVLDGDGITDYGDIDVAFGPDGLLYVISIEISEPLNTTGGNIIIASQRSSGSGGNCDGFNDSGGSDAWNCTTVIDGDSSVSGVSIGFDVSGAPNFFSTDHDSLNTAGHDLIWGRYVGSGGNCDGFEDVGGSDAWQCETVIDSDNLQDLYSTDIVFGDNGEIFGITDDRSVPSGTTAGNLVLLTLKRSGDLLISPTFGGSGTFSESHADMTSTSDSSNNNDNDCITSGSWNTGRYFTYEEGSGLSIADGQSTPQCTEIAFTIDTTQAVAGQTYRFVIATDDAIRQDAGRWRGPVGVDSYPTITIENESVLSTTQTLSKDSLYSLPDCANSNWGCGTIDTTGTTGNVPSAAIAPDGVPWAAYYDASGSSLNVAKYVGAGGNCDTVGAGSDAWDCTVVDDTDGYYSSIGFDNKGNPWVSYISNSTLRVARYVGSGGDCDNQYSGSDAWSCTVLDTNTPSYTTSIGFDKGGNPSISYMASGVKVATYVGSGGNCDNLYGGSDAWKCTLVASSSASATYTSLAFSSSGNAWVSFYAGASSSLLVATFVGSAGNCDSLYSGSDEWQCTAVDVTDTVGEYNSIAFDNSDTAWVSYLDSTNGNLEVAKFVGSGGNCDTVGAGSDAWECTTVDVTGTVGVETSIAIDATGSPWVTHRDTTTFGSERLQVARYVGSGGNCDSVGAGSDAWDCMDVDNTTVDHVTRVIFDLMGRPLLIYFTADLKIATYKGNIGKPVYSTVNTPSPRNARTSYGRYVLSNGKPSASTTSLSCTGLADFMGLCGIAQEDGQNDSITAQANHRPMYQMRARFNNNTVAPQFTWAGQSSLAPSTAGTTGDLKLQVYRFGTTNAWEDVTTNSSCGANTACVLNATPTGTVSEYFEADGSNYWTYWRVIQIESTSSAATLKTDAMRALQPQQLMRHGRTFNRNIITPFDTENR